MRRLQQHIDELRRQRPTVLLLNALTSRDFNMQTNIAYGSWPRQQLDIYSPIKQELDLDGNDDPACPVIIFIHGGTWLHGSKEEYVFLGESFCRAGYVTVVINYRLAPEYMYPAFIEDTAQAIRWVHDNIASYNGDPERIIVMGHSAGAFNAVETVDNTHWLTQVNVPISCIKAVVGIAGPFSFDFRENEELLLSFSERLSPEDIMPDRHVRPDAPPHLLLLATKDELVEPGNSFRMARALRNQGVPVQIKMIDGADHISIIGSIAVLLSWYKPTRQVILSYLDSILKGEAHKDEPLMLPLDDSIRSVGS